jgi:tRNA threonylcarbamoyladenosine biosynthesis protein TsaB
MYILHIETSTKVCSVALSQGDRLVDWIDLEEGMNHTAVLAPTIQQLLKGVSIKVSDLGAISVSSGPGSYTGLRVGCATAKAMAYSPQYSYSCNSNTYFTGGCCFCKIP